MHTHITIIKKKNNNKKKTIIKKKKVSIHYRDRSIYGGNGMIPRFPPPLRFACCASISTWRKCFSTIHLLIFLQSIYSVVSCWAQHFAIELKCISNMPVWRTCVNINVLWTKKKKLKWKGHNVLRMKALHIPVLMPLSWNSALRFRELMAVHDRRNYDF